MSLKDDIKKKTPIVGLNNVLKHVRSKEISRVYISSNCPEKIKIRTNCKSYNVEVIEMEENNKEVGVICKKPFSISVLGFK